MAQIPKAQLELTEATNDAQRYLGLCSAGDAAFDPNARCLLVLRDALRNAKFQGVTTTQAIDAVVGVGLGAAVIGMAGAAA